MLIRDGDDMVLISGAGDAGAHYRYEYKGIKLDPYRVADIYGITNHAQFSALKKLLCTGQRGHKDLKQDIADVICACNRWLEMIDEETEID